MKKALVLLADGFEEIEALTLVDVLRRADVHVTMCSIHHQLEVIGAHGVKVMADSKLEEIEAVDNYDVVVAPGGMPGATNLRDDARVTDIFKSFYANPNKIVAAICAAPIILAKAGIAPQIVGTCYPGFEGEVGYKEYYKQAVVVDRNVLTSMGPGTAFALALKLVEIVVGEEKAKAIFEEMLLSYS